MSQIIDSTIAYIYKEIRLSCGLLYPIKILPYIFKSIARYVTAYFPIINERMCIGIKRDILFILNNFTSEINYYHNTKKAELTLLASKRVI